MKQVVWVLLLGTIIQGIQALELAQYEVDAVEQLLAELKGQSIKELEESRKDFDNSLSQKQSIIASLQESLKNQNNECSSKDRDVNNKQDAIQKTQNYIDYLTKSVAANNIRIKKLRDNRCESNNNYITALKNFKIALRLAKFLHTYLENLGDLSFTQQKQMGNIVLKFLQVYKHAKESDLIELTSDIEKALDSKVDEVVLAELSSNNKITVHASKKQEFLSVLETIINFTTQSIERAQQNEIDIGTGLGNYIAALESENVELTNIGEDELRNLYNLGEQLIQAQKYSFLCKQKITQLRASLETTVKEVESSTAQYKALKSRLEDERDLFDDVYRIYASNVSTQDDRFKQKVQNYVNAHPVA